MDQSSASTPPNNPSLDEPIRWSLHSGSLICDVGQSLLLGDINGVCKDQGKSNRVYVVGGGQVGP